MSISTKRTTRSLFILIFCCLFAGSVALGSGDGGSGGNGGGNGGSEGGGDSGGNGGGGNGGGEGGGNGGGEGGGDSGGNGGGGNGGGEGGGNGGGEGGGNGGGEGGRGTDGTPLNVSKKSYDMGKKVFFEHVVCDTCIYAELELTPESVDAAWRAIKKDLRKSGKIGSNLERRERSSVKLFIRKRFGL